MNILLSPLGIGVVVVVIVLIIFVIALFIWGFLAYRDINKMRHTLKKSLDDIYVVLKEKHNLLQEKFTLCESKEDAKVKALFHEVEDRLDSKNMIEHKNDSYINLLQEITMILRNIEGEIDFIIGDNNSKVKEIDMKLSENEEYIQSTRRLYNSNTSIYNRHIAVFPASVIAHIIATSTVHYFHVDGLTEEFDSVK